METCPSKFKPPVPAVFLVKIAIFIQFSFENLSYIAGKVICYTHRQIYINYVSYILLKIIKGPRF